MTLPRIPHLLTLAALAALLTACHTKPAPTPTSTPAAEKPTTMPAATRAADLALAAHPPAFKLFLQKLDMPAIIVVPEATTDDALKALLWHLRTEIRDQHFAALGLKPTAAVFGTPGYASGVINIYRGEKCAREMYTTNAPDPCGPSIHKAASYHWGDAGDPAADSASLTANGADTLVFTADDGFQTDAEAAHDPTGSLHTAARKRIDYATHQNARQSKAHTDIRFAVNEAVTSHVTSHITTPNPAPDTELRVASYTLATPAGQQAFLREFQTLDSDHLCALGFTSLRLGPLGQPGTPHPIPCAQ